MPDISKEHRALMLEGKRLANTTDEVVSETLRLFSGLQGRQIGLRILETPETFIRTYLKAMEGNNRAAGVKAFCAMCMGWNRENVTKCTDKACPLYPYRPFQ